MCYIDIHPHAILLVQDTQVLYSSILFIKSNVLIIVDLVLKAIQKFNRITY